MADEPAKIYPLPATVDPFPLPLDELFTLALDEDQITLDACLASYTADDLGALLAACRFLTRAVRGELRERTQARFPTEAEEAGNAG